MNALVPEPSPRADVAAPGAPGGHILLVEDQVLIARLLSRQLEKQGHVVITARDGREALEKLACFPADLIISDWVMDRMDGVELCREVRASQEFSSVYFILLTAKEKIEDRLTAFQAGIDEYLVKPVVDQELLERVRVGLRIIRLQRDLSRANARLTASLQHIQKEFEIIGGIQRSLLPDELPHGQMECEQVYQPCEESGGDYYDFVPLKSGGWGLVIADVSGHGAPAMVAMAIIRSLVHSIVPSSESPAAALEAMNSALYRHLPTDQYATMFLAFWDHGRRTLAYSTAGHPLPLVIRRREGRVEELPKLIGFPLKLVDEHASYVAAETALEPGDRFVLYTDGVIEAWNSAREMYDKSRLVDELNRNASATLTCLRREILRSLMDFCGGCPLEDDLTIVLAEVR